MERMVLLQKIISQIDLPVKRLSIQNENITTNYLNVGVGEPLLIIHGGDAGAGGIRWFPVIGHLATYYYVIIPDIVGYGESDKPFASYDRPYFSNWLWKFIDSIGLKKVNIMGHSVGGAIVLQFALDHPEYIDRLILVNSTGLGKGMQKIPNSIKIRMIWQNLFPSLARSCWFLKNYGLYDERTMTSTMVEIEEYGNEVIRNKRGRRVFWLGRGRVIIPFQMDILRQIKQPTLLIWGEEDNNYPPSIAYYTAKMMTKVKVKIITRAGHNCFYDQPEIFIDTIREFLK